MQIIKLSAIDSTNSSLKHMAKQMTVEDETVLVASHQKKGRGQQQNIWHSQQDKSLTFSLYKRFERLPAASHFAISMAVALAIQETLEILKIPNPKIKWPNDIMAGKKKCAGILIENDIKGGFITETVIGVGLNVNETDFDNLPNATSLHLTTQKQFDIEDVLKKIAQNIFTYLLNMQQLSIDVLKKQFEKELFQIGEFHLYKKKDDTFFQGKITGVLLTGELCVENEEGRVFFFNNKEIVYC